MFLRSQKGLSFETGPAEYKSLPRIRLKGPWAGLSISLISSLMGRSVSYTKLILYNYGTAKNNTLNKDNVGELIANERNKIKLTKIRKKLASIRRLDSPTFLR